MDDSILIYRGAKVRDAMQQLEASEAKTLLVVDRERSLYGTVTDGDVRRWILDGGELDGSVEGICNTDPLITSEPYESEAMRQVMISKNITCIPVVDAARRVIDVLLWNQLFGEPAVQVRRQTLDLPVVIMAGGFGTRLSPFTSVLPKPLIPVHGKTVIEMIVDSFTAYGASQFYLSVNYKAKIIKSYFEELDPDYNIDYIEETEPLGTAGSLTSLVGNIQSDLIVTNCDVIINADYGALVQHHRQAENDITLVVSLKNYRIPYGVCEIGEGGVLSEIKEKPEFNFLVNTGLYVLKPHVLEQIPVGKFFHITDLVSAVKHSGGRVGVYPISDKAWLDTGEWSEYRNAVAAMTADRRKARFYDDET